MEVVRATKMFVPGILNVANKLDYSRLSEAERREFGFLIPYSEEEYIDFAGRADYFYVLRENEKVVGFVLAHSSAKLDQYGGEVYLYIKATQAQPFLVIRQICIDKDRCHCGYGRILLNYLIQQLERDATQKRQTVVDFIWKKPRNSVSEEFHKRLGFEEVDTHAHSDGKRVAGIWKLTI